ncbi:MAG: general secretion pathway protein GspF [Pseudomonadota bacterium]|nr:general secretion pathway protein GspF [Pseudomonadota bacterium]
MSKKSKPLGIHDPLLLQEHPRPRTRREFVAQSFMTGAATVIGPTLAGMLAYPRSARALNNSLLAPDLLQAVTACNITTGAGKIPFICFDLAGGGNIAGSNVLVGGPKGQLDFLSVAGYSKLGLPGSMVPSPSATGNFIDSSFGLRYHSDSAHLRGMKLRASAKAMAGTTGTIIPALSQNDTNTNPHNPMYGIYQFGARGGLLNLIGSDSSQSGGNSMAPPTMVIAAAQPTKVSSSQDSKGLVSTGQLSTLLPPLPNGTNPDVVNVLESMKRISDAKYKTVTAYAGDPGGLNTAALGTAGIQACSFTKAAYIVDQYGSPSAVNPDVDPNIVGGSGIFTTAEYQANSDYRKTAAVMKLVIDGNAAAGTIEMGGFDYHSGNRMDGEARDLNLGNCIGACLEYAARVGKPVMIYVFSDGSLASNGMIDSSVGGRGKGVWTADNQSVAATYFLVFNPAGRAVAAQANPEMSTQIGYFNSDGSQNTTGSPAGNNVPNLVQMVVLNYMALHSANAIAQWPTLFPPPNLNNTLGSGTALEPLIAWQPLAGLKNGLVA